MNLDIYLGGQHVATTVPRSRGRKFAIEYTAAALTDTPDEAIVLSCSLPTPGPGRPGSARAFLEGLLPEGHALEVMAGRVRGVRLSLDDGSPAEPNDALELLAAYGRECAGAVVLVPEGEDPPGDGGYRQLDDQQVSALIAGLPENPLGADLAADVRMSIAGNQPKLLLARLHGRWCEPVAGAASTHIIKPAVTWPLSADNEAIVLGIAHAVGLTDSAPWVDDFGGMRALVTERFDRVVDSATGVVRRRHQEDMCQAIGLRPRDKYRIGRPSQKMAGLLRTVPTADGTDSRKLLAQTAFRAIVGDEDGHGKNYGLVLEDGEVALAPMYDSLATMVYPELSGKMAAPVGQQTNLAKVDIEALVEEGAACGTPADESRQIVLDLADRVKSAAAQQPGDGLDARALEAVTRTITTRALRLIQGKPMGQPPNGAVLSANHGAAAPNMDAATRRRLSI